MLARVARVGRGSPPPDARGFLGKARPPRVSRGLRVRRAADPDGRQANIPAPPARNEGCATAAITRSGFWTPPSGPVMSGPGKRMRTRGTAAPEKRTTGARGRPYRIPTQVGWQRMPRRAGEPWPRNSAKPPRNLGRRGAAEMQPQRRGPGDCLPKTQDGAKARADVCRLTPARCRKVTRSRQRKRSGDAKPR